MLQDRSRARTRAVPLRAHERTVLAVPNLAARLVARQMQSVVCATFEEEDGMEEYAHGDLLIEVAEDDGVFRLRWRGKSHARDPGATLRPFLDRVAGAAKASGADVEMRLNELEYFNSSTLAALIRAIRLFRDQATKVVISYQESAAWQRRSFEALRVLESDGIVEIRGD